MDKVDFLIFSRNRAMQLEALLSSLHHYLNPVEIGKIGILYKSDQRHLESYHILMKSWPDLIWIIELDFRNQVLEFLEACPSEYASFLVDDLVFYRSPESPILPGEDLCFSLRLGENCFYSHPANTWYRHPDFIQSDSVLRWDWRLGECDFGYPFSLDGHVFRKKIIQDLCQSLSFKNPNSLENSLAYNRNIQFQTVPSIMRSSSRSCVVGVPVNRVNEEVENRFGIDHRISEEELLEMFLQGKRIDPAKMDFSQINGPHKELRYEFKESSNSRF